MDEPIQTYFIELKAINIDKLTRKQSNRLNYSSELVVQLLLSNQKTLLAQSSWAYTEALQGNIKCQNASLRVALNIHPEHFQQWTLTILGKENQANQQQLRCLNLPASNISIKKSVKKLGQGQLSPSIYVQILKDCGKFKFLEHMQISNTFSLCYEVYISNSLQGLEDILIKEQQKKQVQITDNAFKKLPGNPKIRYVEFKQNREKSIRSEQFFLNQDRKIASLKKSGTKYIPVSKQPLPPCSLQERTYKQLRRQKTAKDTKAITSLSPRRDKTGSEFSKDNQRQAKQRRIQQGRQESIVKRGNISWYCLLILLMAILVGGYMMFPSKKV